MFKRSVYFALILSAACSTAASSAIEVIDRIVATVNGHIILQSDVDEAVSYQAFAENRPLTSATADQRKAALDRLIDQELIREEVRASDFQTATAPEIDARITEIRQWHGEASDDSSWLAALHTYGLTADELREKVAADLNSWKAVEARLRPSGAIDNRSIERYYQESFLPELRKQGGQEVSLAAVAPKIKEILAQQQINELLADWLRTLRNESKIQIATISSLQSGGGSR